MNFKRLIKSLLLIFVVFSFAFLVYKEFSPKSESNATNAAETLRDKASASISIKENRPTIEITEQQQKVPLKVPDKAITLKVIAYYFHGTFRCTTCRTIEKYSKEAIEKFFANELQDGRLKFRPVNIEAPENRHYVQDYQLFTRSLVLSMNKDDKEVKWKNLQEVWTHVRDKERFFQYVKDEVEQFLKEIG